MRPGPATPWPPDPPRPTACHATTPRPCYPWPTRTTSAPACPIHGPACPMARTTAPALLPHGLQSTTPRPCYPLPHGPPYGLPYPWPRLPHGPACPMAPRSSTPRTVAAHGRAHTRPQTGAFHCSTIVNDMPLTVHRVRNVNKSHGRFFRYNIAGKANARPRASLWQIAGIRISYPYRYTLRTRGNAPPL